MKHPLPVVLLAALACAGGARAKDAPPKLTEALVESARGVFDLSKNPRPFVVFMILDQAGNRYPSFWCGRNLEGNVTFNARMDPLTEAVDLRQKGAFTLQLGHTAHKRGMDGVLPGGAWIADLRGTNIAIAVREVADPRFREVVERRFSTGRGLTDADKVVVFDVKLRGTVSVGARSAPFEGKAAMGFVTSPRAFTLQATFPFPGRALGLEGPAGEGITATLYTSSATVVAAPPVLDDAGTGLDGLLP